MSWRLPGPRLAGTDPATTRREWLWLAAAAVLLFIARVAFLPPTLDDIDAINFDLGVHDYDPSRFQPHPPGYPVYIAAARIAHAVVDAHSRALGSLSAVFGALSVLPLYFLVRELSGPRTAALAGALTLLCPLVWFNGARPMSDVTGLFAVLTAQCLLLVGLRRMDQARPGGARLWRLGVVAAALAIGVRSQALFLVGPLLLWGWVRRPEVRISTPILALASGAAWFVPMVALSGGLERYTSSLALLLSTALPVEPLLSSFTLRRAVYGLWDVVGRPWGPSWLAVTVLATAAAGGVRWMLARPAALGWTLLLFLPYALYHYLLQMTEAVRYAIPVVPLMAILAAAAIADLGRRWSWLVPVGGTAFVLAAAVTTLPALAAYRATPSPAAQALTEIDRLAATEDVVIAGHPVFERYLARLAARHQVLPHDFERPLRALAEYWQGGDERPVLFLRNPGRTSLLHVSRTEQTSLGRWRWPAAVRPFMRGERPGRVELVRITPPQWFAESGFMVTREAGQPDRVAREPKRLRVRSGRGRRVVIASGTLLAGDTARVELRRPEASGPTWDVPSDFTIRTHIDAVPASGYESWTFESDAPVLFTDVWIDDARVPVIRPGRGFHSPERDEDGRLFRWMSAAASAEAFVPVSSRLTLRGWVPVKYYDGPVTLDLVWNGERLASVPIAGPEFRLEQDLPPGPAGWGTLSMTASRHFVPDDLQRSGDRRVLSVQIHEMSLVPSPGAVPGARP